MGEAKRRKKSNPNYGKKTFIEVVYETYSRNVHEDVACASVLAYQDVFQEILSKEKPINYYGILKYEFCEHGLFLDSKVAKLSQIQDDFVFINNCSLEDFINKRQSEILIFLIQSPLNRDDISSIRLNVKELQDSLSWIDNNVKRWAKLKKNYIINNG